MVDAAWAALGAGETLRPTPGGGVAITGEGGYASAFAVTDLAVASVAVAGLALADLIARDAGAPPQVRVDRRLASLWFGWSLRPIGWTMPASWDPLAGDYACADGWIRLHTNAPAHRAAALRTLGGAIGDAPARAAVSQLVAQWRGQELEEAIVSAGGCAAFMRDAAAWAASPAATDEPLVIWGDAPASSGQGHDWRPDPRRPLAGVRVLDLTRVLAGPVATRFLAACGADVLRIDPPGWDEAGVIPEVTVGKRCARLDLRQGEDRALFAALVQSADVIVHGYRPMALERLGFGADWRQRLNPGLIDVALDAWGWSGPWRGRRGFDSLVQMSTGIAQAGMAWSGAETPTPLPVQALDHATGWLMAAAVLRCLRRRRDGAAIPAARLSLTATGAFLAAAGRPAATQLSPAGEADFAPEVEQTDWGPALRLHQPLEVAGVALGWSLPARRLGADAAAQVAADWRN